MNLPNAITLIRLIVTVLVFVCLGLMGGDVEADRALAWWAFALFIFAAVTDFLDGYLARRLNQVSMFGRVFDPFADKVLICGTFIALLTVTPSLGALLPAWFVIVIVARELLVTTLRGAAEAQGIAFPAERIGKLKMVAQSVTAAALISIVAGTQTFHEVAVWGMWLTLVLTVWSGLGYVWKARSLLTS